MNDRKEVACRLVCRTEYPKDRAPRWHIPMGLSPGIIVTGTSQVGDFQLPCAYLQYDGGHLPIDDLRAGLEGRVVVFCSEQHGTPVCFYTDILTEAGKASEQDFLLKYSRGEMVSQRPQPQPVDVFLATIRGDLARNPR